MKYLPRLFLLAILFALFLRLTQIQIFRNDYYENLSERNRIRKEVKPASRGRIYSREKKIIAESRPSFSLTIDPYRITDNEINRLCDILKMDRPFIERKIKPYFRTCRIRRVSLQSISKIAEKLEKFPSVRFITEPVRYYPHEYIFSHLLGYTGEITWEELHDFPDRYRRGDIVGKKGVELQYEEYLQGKKGISLLEVDARGRVVRKFSHSRNIEPKRGYDIVLTISEGLTLYTDSLFGEYSSGASVAINPQNGELILYYSKPGYPTNMLTGGISENRWDSLSNEERAPLWDRVISGEYPPGSIQKILTTILAFNNNIIKEQENFTLCNGVYRIGDRDFRCWSEHGKLKIKDAIIQSCDIYFYQVGMRMTLEEVISGLIDLKLGEKCGVDLPGEREGFLPSRHWYNKKYGSRGWDRGVKANLAIGQGEILATPLQIVTIFSAILNGGKTFKPHILKKVIDRRGNTVEKGDKEPFSINVSDSTLQILKDAMVNVVNSEEGTAYWSRLRNIKVGGKTGTAQNPHGEDHSLFVGFAPAEKPVICVFTIVENAGHGSAHAAPITTKIIKKYLTDKSEISESP